MLWGAFKYGADADVIQFFRTNVSNRAPELLESESFAREEIEYRLCHMMKGERLAKNRRIISYLDNSKNVDPRDNTASVVLHMLEMSPNTTLKDIKLYTHSYIELGTDLMNTLLYGVDLGIFPAVH
mgnify:CR=1 FL=1